MSLKAKLPIWVFITITAVGIAVIILLIQYKSSVFGEIKLQSIENAYWTKTIPHKNVLVETNLNCKDSSNYFVISKDAEDGMGSDFLVKYKTNKDQIIPCGYIVEKTDFELKNQAATFFLALTDNFLILDRGTAPPPRVFIVYNLNTRKEVYTGSYSTPTSIKNDVFTYWRPTNEKTTNENCPKLSEYTVNGLGAEIEAYVSIDLSNLVKKESGEYRCSPTQ